MIASCRVSTGPNSRSSRPGASACGWRARAVARSSRMSTLSKLSGCLHRKSHQRLSYGRPTPRERRTAGPGSRRASAKERPVTVFPPSIPRTAESGSIARPHTDPAYTTVRDARTHFATTRATAVRHRRCRSPPRRAACGRIGGDPVEKLHAWVCLRHTPALQNRGPEDGAMFGFLQTALSYEELRPPEPRALPHADDHVAIDGRRARRARSRAGPCRSWRGVAMLPNVAATAAPFPWSCAGV